MNNLRPCPICKGKALFGFQLIKDVKHYYIKCTECGISTMPLKDKQYLVFCWENVPL